MALRRTGQAAGNTSAGNARASCNTQGIHPWRVQSQRGLSDRIGGSVSGTPR